jgi:hypothetical protein
MLTELFEKFPEYVAFQILTYCPHPDSELILVYWAQKRQKRHMSYVVNQLYWINLEMNQWMEQEEVDTFTFYDWYMYGESPYSDENSVRWINSDGDWYRQ